METSNREALREEIASEVSALLARKRISAVELARRLGWKQGYMARRIVGRVAFDMDDLEAICAELRVPVLALLRRELEAISAAVGVPVASVLAAIGEPAAVTSPRSVMSEAGVTTLEPSLPERMSRGANDKGDHRPKGRPSDSSTGPRNRRTSRVPRPDRRKRA